MHGTAPAEEPRARPVSKYEVGPESPVERRESITRYLIRRRRERQDRFIRRAAAVPLRKEFARNLFLAGCLLFDVLVAPYPIFLIPGAIGWIGAGLALPLAAYVEYQVYRTVFALPAPDEPDRFAP